jgi:hypothetical protein
MHMHAPTSADRGRGAEPPQRSWTRLRCPGALLAGVRGTSSVPTSSVRGCRREGAPPCLALCTASLPRSAPLLGTHPPGFLSYTKSTWDWRDHRQACEGRSPQGSCTGLCLHHPARVMPALADACHLFPSPRLAPHEMPGTPTSCPHHLADQGQGVHVPWSLLTTLSQSERGLSWCMRVGGEVSVAEESSSQKTTGSMPIRSWSCSVAACSPKAPMQKKPQTSTSGVAFPCYRA